MGKSKRIRKPKNELVFDPKKREDFLTGFTKRKQQRKKKAQDEMDKQLKVEKKRLQDEVSLLLIMQQQIQLLNNFHFRQKT